MSIREIFNFKGSFTRINLENEVDNQSPKNEDTSGFIDEEEMLDDLRTEWNQEYELIYLSYVLER